MGSRKSPPSREKVRPKSTFKDIASIALPYRTRWVGTIILSFIQAGFFMQFPLVIQAMTVAIIDASTTGLFAALAWLLVIFSGFSIILYLRLKYCGFWVANHIIYDVRWKLMDSMLNHSYKFVDEQQSGDLVSVTTSDVNMMRNFLSFQFPYALRMVVQLAGLLVMLAVISPPLLFVLLPVFPFMFLSMYIYKKKIHPMTFEQREIFGDLTSRLQENISGIEVVRAFATEGHEFFGFSKLNRDYAKKSRKIGLLSAILDPSIHMLMNIGRAIVIGFGGMLVLQGAVGLSLDETIAFIPALGLLIEPVVFLSWMAGEYGRVQAAYDRIKEVLDAPVEILERASAIEIPRLEGEVTFKDVTFGYSDGKPVLSNVNIHVPAGSTVALLGATGSGKTTLVNLLCRFYDVDSGQIILDGKYDVRDVSLDSYRRQIGIVAQEPFLFQQTMRDNLTHGLGGIPDEDIMDACKMADIIDIVESRKEGLDTVLGERGVTVSGGQKQRLTLARAILRNPRILVLDAATSSVDVDTEYEILMNLKRLFKTCTTIIITQRLSTVKSADYIYLLDSGRVVEQGTHADLMALDAKYAMLYRTVTRSPAGGQRRGEP